ncbi:glycosyltransferase family 9 protein [Asaia spathodeae]|uniref:Glycosyltransferase family 9 protein n=1 Tax=Asaia spathodeae TaxID=657016 RepID=A0ABX2P7C0_9PROT|nr:glycosyltransferase family 9 protein [Asaia spathodeae]GBR15808.1 lipopolysaccharide heptosyltransferase [Asaia spathodeae NBRC 105894]
MLRILVIKLGALGDFIQALAPFAAIRAHWPEADITLLTTAPFEALALASPYFDHVSLDERPRWSNPAGLLRLRNQLRGYDLVIDLQTSGRTTRYFRLAGQKRWSGIARRGAYPHDNPYRDAMHSVARQRDQLARLGVPDVTGVDLDWLGREGPEITGPYAVLVPGAAPHRPAKRWPVQHYATLARSLQDQGLKIVVAGTQAERPLGAAILEQVPDARDLTGKTDLLALGGILARASLAVGNDTGPMHLAGAMGCPSLVLFSAESNPRLTAPNGVRPGQMRVLAVDDLRDLDVSRVAACLNWGH